MRFTQGVLACFTVALLVVSTGDVIDIVLNFTAVNFISGFDNAAFELAQWGKYGPKLKREADRIGSIPAPVCTRRTKQHVRYMYTIFPLAIVLFAFIVTIAVKQDSIHAWHTDILRVQFHGEQASLSAFSGCYEIDESVKQNSKWSLYKENEANEKSARFGYCKIGEDGKSRRKWYLFKGNKTSACDAVGSEDVLAVSDMTYAYDISDVFESNWYSTTGAPLELFFFWDDELANQRCSDFIGDGKCNVNFNSFKYEYDGGDCCSFTCDGASCGKGLIESAFGTNSFGHGFTTCKEPSQHPITIRINRLYQKEGLGWNNNPDENNPVDKVFAELGPRNPLMILDCDGSNVLTVNIEKAMVNQTETVMVNDGANCTLLVKNVTSGPRGIYYVDYTVFHGNKTQIDDNPIVIINGDSYTDCTVYFQRIYNCYFDTLSKYISNTSIYVGNKPQNKAIYWLLKDAMGFSSCEYESFVERYALATINFNMPLVDDHNETSPENLLISDNLWISESRQCTWSNVVCMNDSVIELDLTSDGLGRKMIGNLPTEIGLLQNLTKLDIRYQFMSGLIPSEIGSWSSLDFLSFEGNSLTSTIPSEIGLLSNLEYFFVNGNKLTGTIPDIGVLSKLRGFFVYQNYLTGSVPESIGKSMQYFLASNNFLVGTIPNSYGKLQNLEYLDMSHIFLSGTIPASLGQLDNLDYIDLAMNLLTGSIPAKITNKVPSYTEFNVYGNELKDLIPIDGQVICTAPNNITGEIGEHYCNCGSDCLRELRDGAGQRCQCEEARSCCNSYFVDNNITNCIVCEEGFTNPNFAVPKWAFVTCGEALPYVYDALVLFGTEEACNDAKVEMQEEGCVCPSYKDVPPEEDGNILI